MGRTSAAMRDHEPGTRETLVDRMRARGVRITEQRRVIADLLDDADDHLDAESIYRLASARDPRIHRATVYRTMEILVDLNLVRPLYLNDPTQRFVSATGGHHHLVCAHCGVIIEFDDCTADQLAQELSERYNFRIHSHLLWLGLAGHFLGYNTVFMWAWKYREPVMDALEIARKNPDKKVVFLGVGFETTAPTIAMSRVVITPVL